MPPTQDFGCVNVIDLAGDQPLPRPISGTSRPGAARARAGWDRRGWGCGDRQGRLKLGELVTRRQPLTAINQCFADMKAGSVARSVIVFD